MHKISLRTQSKLVWLCIGRGLWLLKVSSGRVTFLYSHLFFYVFEPCEYITYENKYVEVHMKWKINRRIFFKCNLLPTYPSSQTHTTPFNWFWCFSVLYSHCISITESVRVDCFTWLLSSIQSSLNTISTVLHFWVSLFGLPYKENYMFVVGGLRGRCIYLPDSFLSTQTPKYLYFDIIQDI